MRLRSGAMRPVRSHRTYNTKMIAPATLISEIVTTYLDADITGPSMARLFGVKARPFEGPDKKPHPPATSSGIQIMSMNLILDEEAQAVIWRGPMVSGAIRQFYTDLEWGKLDYLLVDL